MVSPQVKDLDRLDPYVKKQTAKLTQVVQNFFTKAVQIILTARSDDLDASDSKINKWFNLLMPVGTSSTVNKDELKLWKSCGDLSVIPPMIIETCVDLRNLPNRNALVLKDDSGTPWGVVKDGNKKQEVVIERWLIEFDSNEVSGSIIDELPLIYKQAIILFRGIYGFLRLMPAYKLRQKLRLTSKITLTSRVLDGRQSISSKGRIGLSKAIVSSESHLIQRNFNPIQTTLGTIKVSTIYRKHSDFVVTDSEEVLSSHFVFMDDNLLNSKEKSVSPSAKDPVSVENSADNSTEKLASELGTTKPLERRPSQSSRDDSPHKPMVAGRPAIQPFRVGSIGSSPPPQSLGNLGSSSLERRISITSNKSTSNVSLAAILRNPRGSTSSTTGNIPISTGLNVVLSIPRSICSSHGEESPNPEVLSSTPRFSSSFGSRASRRFSNTSVRQSMLHQNLYDQSYLGTSSGLATSVNPLSGIYIDDDIGDFVRMIDSKTDLRFAGSTPRERNPESDLLNKFQLMKYQHQQLGDSVNQSLILQANTSNPASIHNESRTSSRKSSHSRSYSPHDARAISNLHLPTIDSKLDEKKPPAKDVRGLSTTPSVYANRRSIQYENVFEDDDGEDYYLQLKDHKDEEDDDLLFTMSDMNLTK